MVKLELTWMEILPQAVKLGISLGIAFILFYIALNYFLPFIIITFYRYRRRSAPIMLWPLLVLVVLFLVSVIVWPLLPLFNIPRFGLLGFAFFGMATLMYLLVFLTARKYFEETGDSMAGVVWILALVAYILFIAMMLI